MVWESHSICYLELDVNILSKHLPRMGVLVVKSPQDSYLKVKKSLKFVF